MNPAPLPYRPNPLAAWFLLLTSAAVLCTILSGAFASGHNLVGGLVGAVALAAVLSIVGLFFRPRLRNAGVGFVTGAVVGGIAGLLLSVPSDEFTLSLFAVLAGSVMIVVVGIVGRSVR